jgi:hypothetical protein
MRDLAQLLDHAGQAGRRARELLAKLEPVRRRGRLGGPELQPERHEPLLCAIVEVALDAVALGVGGSRDRRERAPAPARRPPPRSKLVVDDRAAKGHARRIAAINRC